MHLKLITVIFNLHISHNTPRLYAKIFQTFVFLFSRVLLSSQEKLKTTLMHNSHTLKADLAGTIFAYYD